MKIGEKYRYPFSGELIEIVGIPKNKKDTTVKVKYVNSVLKSHTEYPSEYFENLIERGSIELVK